MARRKVSKVFKHGKTYVFDLNTFLKDMGEDPNRGHWPVDIDGMKVDIDENNDGYIDNYLVHPDWCKEVPNDKP